jgi:hypothetical protein
VGYHTYSAEINLKDKISKGINGTNNYGGSLYVTDNCRPPIRILVYRRQ